MTHESRIIDMDKQACERLASAIILQAVSDYRKALRRRQRAQDHVTALGRIRECERFFRSKFYAVLTDVDGETLIRMIRAELDAKE